MQKIDLRALYGTTKIINLEDVFKTSGVPTHTFVKPQEYTKLLVALRTNGKGLIIEGPSGIGKTTSVNQAIKELGLNQHAVITLSARTPSDVEMITMLPELKDVGIVIIDDFHVLSNEIKKNLSDFMKTLADEEYMNSKLILVGINKAGTTLVSFSPDLNNRIDTIKFEANPDNKIDEMISLGEAALRAKINIKPEIISESHGSFHIAQLLAQEACIACNIINNNSGKASTHTSIETIREKVLEDLSRVFFAKTRDFATGSKIRKEGRAPYLHLLYWLSQSSAWSIEIDSILHQYPKMKVSINQVIEKGYLQKLLEDKATLQDVIHFDNHSKILTIEDPKFFFYLKNIDWDDFAKQIGYSNIKFTKSYDFALSFAGENRDFADEIFNQLTEREISVFYDRNEQHRILGENVAEYLAPIYKSDAEYVIAILSNNYPKKMWPIFESEQFKSRFGENAVIPIWYSDTTRSSFDKTIEYGGFTYDVNKELKPQVAEFVEILSNKLQEQR
ncbi:ATPase AAA [Candidatus Symbiothrix dinenymphae]|nr:ATPase AAA [Candidatus Symbiothrix dinenymphae]